MHAGVEALSLAPDNPQLLLWMGLDAADGNLEVGLRLVRQALELQPSLRGFLDRIPATAMPAAPAVRATLPGRPPVVHPGRVPPSNFAIFR